ncbi:uncharacterized protein LOC131952404 [Physella acuta]|uniref:uncharacterized protein LOC131952404 n=1 Tax=Physella acuta TaxID=109671 RepID=UPI0027DE19DA|nr:uncharacterized protein LOC131952404 [Physella acuta]
MTETLYRILQQRDFQYLGYNITIRSISFNETYLNATSTLCDIREAIEPCLDGKVCYFVNSTHTGCRYNTDNTNLIIGLAVGIPVFFLLTAIIAVCVYMRVKRRNKGFLDKYSEYSNDDKSVFADHIAPQGDWRKWNMPRGMNDAYVTPKPDNKTEPSHFYDYLDAKPRKEGMNEGNFSWDFMFKTLEPDGQEFKLQRPKINLGFHQDT